MVALASKVIERNDSHSDLRSWCSRKELSACSHGLSAATELIASFSVHVQVVGTVDESYNTLKPYSANRADIGSIEVTGNRAAVFPQSLEVDGTPCEIIVSSHNDA